MGGRGDLEDAIAPLLEDRSHHLGEHPRVGHVDLVQGDEARAVGFRVEVLKPARVAATVTIAGQRLVATTAADTEDAATRMVEGGVSLILFAGGDGTARNIYNAVGDRLPVVGIPAGVKIHSAVYANTPRNAGDLAAHYLNGSRAVRLREAEVMDIDEDAFRHDRVSARLYGYLRIPYERQLVQSAKAGSQVTDEALYLIGAGTTTAMLMRLLELPDTLLGVDAVRDRRLVGSDLGEAQLLRLVEQAQADGASAFIVVAVIGGQGHVFGRGSQQFSPAVIRAVGRANVIVVATQTKLLSLDGAPLRVDTGDEALDAELAGWVKVVTGHGQRTMYRMQ